MAVLSNADRAAVWSFVMTKCSNLREEIACSKADLRLVINAIDDWLEANAASLNQAIPQPARSQLSAPLKALLLAVAALKRWGGVL